MLCLEKKGNNSGFISFVCAFKESESVVRVFAVRVICSSKYLVAA